MYVDSHCHIDFPDLASRTPAILSNMAEHQVSHALCVSVNLADWPRVLSLAEQHHNLFASVGVHPDYEDVEEPDIAGLVERARHPKVIAIGETGLDYFRLQGDLGWQRARFVTHIHAAREAGLPLIIHTRSSAEDTLRIMAEEGAREVGGVMHCFTETLEVAQAAIDMDFYISFSGIVTFKNATALKEVARAIPLERILIETDSPYLAPVPHRGKTNEPAWVKHVAEEIARLRGDTVENIAAASTRNFFTLFKKAAA